jgi:ribosomal protein S21
MTLLGSNRLLTEEKMNRQKNELGLEGVYVEVKNNDLGKALRKFKKKLSDDGILQDIRKKEFYQSKGTKRRIAKLAAIRRFQKNRGKEQDI